MLSVASIVTLLWHILESVRPRWLIWEHHAPKEENRNVHRWWHEVGVPFGVLLGAAGYPSNSRLQHLKSFAMIAIPYFGHYNERPSSFMTDNGCPVEFSWDWGWNGCSPSVRYSMEPLCLPLQDLASEQSREAAALKFVAELSRSHGVPLQIFRYFWQALALQPELKALYSSQLQEEASSQFFAGFDCVDDTFVFKAYFLPTLQAHAQGCSRYAIIKSALVRSPGWSAFATPFATIDEFMETSSLGRQLDAEIFSLDVASTSPTRYKLYARCATTTFASVREIASLGGRIASRELTQSLAQLHQLWLALFQPTSEDEEHELPPLAHRTAGILYYFEMCAGKPVSTPKIYLPVRHYAANDAQIEQTVASFVSKQAMAMGGDASRSVRQFRAAMSRISQGSSVEAQKGLHTYIGCTLERGTIKLISYINPSPGSF